MALVLTRNSGESIIFKNKSTHQLVTLTVLRITEKSAAVRFTVGDTSQERKLVANEPIEFFDGSFCLNMRDGRAQVRVVCDFPSNVNIARKELLK
jgi:sRNA-binding carbon storage regulator CsrA